MFTTFNDASFVVKEPFFIDAVIRGLLVQPVEQVDLNVANDLWNKLFKFELL
jgi:hypothetical protein